MGILLLVTSSLMVDIYVKYCHYLEEQHPEYDSYHRYYHHYNDDYSQPKCGDRERPFVVLPVFGYITMVTWVRCLWNDA